VDAVVPDQRCLLLVSQQPSSCVFLCLAYEQVQATTVNG
jgi:hypothetical protein